MNLWNAENHANCISFVLADVKTRTDLTPGEISDLLSGQLKFLVEALGYSITKIEEGADNDRQASE